MRLREVLMRFREVATRFRASALVVAFASVEPGSVVEFLAALVRGRRLWLWLPCEASRPEYSLLAIENEYMRGSSCPRAEK